MLKLPGEMCNINCHYCYERRKPYPNALMLKPDLLRSFLETCGERPLAIELHGGEPLLIGRKKMAALFEEIRAYPGPVSVAMQTNGILLDGAWLDFFDREWPGIEIGVSLDGDMKGNSHRVDFADRPTYPKVVRALELLAARGRQVGVITVVTRHVLGRAGEVLDTLAAFEAVKTVKLSGCLDFNVRTKNYRTPNRTSLKLLNPDGVGMPGWATSPGEYAEFLIEAFDHWHSTKSFRSYMLEPFFSIIRSLSGLPAGYSGYSDRKEPFIVTLYPDGRVGSSDELSMPTSLLSRVGDFTDIDDLLTLDGNAPLRGDLSALLAKCAGCSHLASCRGGALPDRLRFEGTGFEEEYCDHRRQVIDHVAAALPTASAPELTTAS
ncbi:radical SAM protein [Streptomyces sp. NBC_00859]|uniref:radical SAM protein n=1 Tax=Streptomyces sp. NBC_00859 TaxID=2903682 RepID=UPI00386EBE21|nr:radical SAM protein [Streptomyces sp. NBC_00859]WSZ86712.1 radical SAM protein [Streptomyces sp. NBC_00859]